MFTSKNLLSEVTCPYQATCILPGCIFGHPEVQIRGTQASFNTEDLPLKIPSKAAPEKFHEEAVSTSKPVSKDLDATSKKRILGIDRDISPPPLRRKALNGQAIPIKQSLEQNSSPKVQITAPSTPKPVIKEPAKAAPKKESLNPRPLKGTVPAKHEFRYRLVKGLHEHLVRLNTELKKDANDSEERLVLTDQELISKALDVEQNAALQASIYSNVVKNSILRYKKMTVLQWKEEREKELEKAKAVEASLLSDTPMSKPVEPPKPIETGLSINEELTLLPRLYTPTRGLSGHGYVVEIPSDQDIETARTGIEAAKGWEVCDRCKSRFQVFPERREEDGALASQGTCTYHFGKPYWQDRSATDPKAKREKKYRCCEQPIGDSPGCTTAENHVFKISEVKRMATILNFQKTPENPEKASDRPVCIDGEMGYTVYGLELIRLTATSWPNGEELFDVLVRPIGPILDLNSRYSGVWPNDMADAIPWDSAPEPSQPTPEPGKRRKLRIVESPAAARALLFSHLSPQTPLVGHGLENDLNATRIIHPTIIDTALLYPHKAGLPYRNGLKMLMHTHLNRHIQVVVNGKMEGHDSKEDANAAGDLVRLALRNEWQKMKKDGWVLDGTEFKPPLPRDFPLGVPTGPGKKRSRQEMEEDEVGEVEG